MISGRGHGEVFVNDQKVSFCVPLKDLRGTDEFQFLFNAFAASEIASGGLELKRIGRDRRIRPD